MKFTAIKICLKEGSFEPLRIRVPKLWSHNENILVSFMTNRESYTSDHSYEIY